jgi:hypothetical protein
MMVITWTNWNLIREQLGTSWPYGGSGGNGWGIVAVRGAEPQEDATSRNPGKEGTVIHR